MRKFDIIGHTKWWFILSLFIIIPGIFSMCTRGFNLGIDFTGGTIIEMKFDHDVTLSQVRDVLRDYQLDNSTIQLSGDASNAEAAQDVMIRTIDMEENDRKAVMASLKEKIGDYNVLREEKVGATMGADLIENALLALVLSWVLIVVYVSYRFELRFGISAILALVHDIFIVLSVFSLLQKQVDSSFVAALLTIVGYSINDTIVIFDRIRETNQIKSKITFTDVINKAITDTLSRTILTGITTLFALLVIFLVGGEALHDFAFVMLFGIVIGTYSSVYIASPVVLWWEKWRSK